MTNKTVGLVSTNGTKQESGTDRQPASVWGSDAVAAVIRELGIPYVCLTPGASFRGLHDSLVNYLGNTQPEMLLCLHEEHAVGMAHGYAKVTGKPLAAIVHSNVGLMHASMAIFNAWCDRVPVLVLGATGPVDAAKRRPWIDWIHTSRDQGALVRNFIKWDDQPGSVAAAQESLLRAALIANTAPRGPVYVCLDASLQETRLDAMPSMPDVRRYQAPPAAYPASALLDSAVDLLRGAARPVILMGRVSRSEAAWRDRVALAESLGATVMTDLKIGASFPTAHPLHVDAPSFALTPAAAARLREADVVLSLDWLDLAGTLSVAWQGGPPTAKIVQVSVDQQSHNGWSMDHQGLPPVDLYLLCEPDVVVPLLLEKLRAVAVLPRAPHQAERGVARAATPSDPDCIGIADMAAALRQAISGIDVCLVRLPIGWSGEMWDFAHPLDYLGYDGGGGIGSGPSMAVGSALALKDSGRLAVAVLGDGDYLMGVTALWTAAQNKIPLLVVVANNRSYFNDELHQERVALERGRPVENRWIGQRIGDPDVDLAQMARGQGLEGVGPVEKPHELAAVFAAAVASVRAGNSCVVDVRVKPGYGSATTAAMVRGGGKS